MSEERDRWLSELYRASAREQPPESLDRSIVAAARKAARPAMFASWGAPLAAAAVVVVAVSLVITMREDAGYNEIANPMLAERKLEPKLLREKALSKEGAAAMAPKEEAARSAKEKVAVTGLKEEAASRVAKQEAASRAEVPARSAKDEAATKTAREEVAARAPDPEPKAALSDAQRERAIRSDAKRSADTRAKVASQTPLPSSAAENRQLGSSEWIASSEPIASREQADSQQPPPAAAAEAPQERQRPVDARPAPAAPAARIPPARSSTAEPTMDERRLSFPAAASPAAGAREAREAPQGRLESAAKQLSPEAWLKRIIELRNEGRIAEANESLAEFRKRHPDYPLPAALK